MKEDPIIAGATAGLIANIAKDAGNLISILLNWTNYYYWHLAASIFVEPESVKKPGALFLGFLGDNIIAATFGIILYYLISYTGKRFFIIKGLGLSWLLWVFLFGAVINLDIVRITPTDIGTNLSAFLNHSLFGIVSALLLKKIMKATFFS